MRASRPGPRALAGCGVREGGSGFRIPRTPSASAGLSGVGHEGRSEGGKRAGGRFGWKSRRGPKFNPESRATSTRQCRLFPVRVGGGLIRGEGWPGRPLPLSELSAALAAPAHIDSTPSLASSSAGTASGAAPSARAWTATSSLFNLRLRLAPLRHLARPLRLPQLTHRLPCLRRPRGPRLTDRLNRPGQILDGDLRFFTGARCLLFHSAIHFGCKGYRHEVFAHRFSFGQAEGDGYFQFLISSFGMFLSESPCPLLVCTTPTTSTGRGRGQETIDDGSAQLGNLGAAVRRILWRLRHRRRLGAGALEDLSALRRESLRGRMATWWSLLVMTGGAASAYLVADVGAACRPPKSRDVRRALQLWLLVRGLLLCSYSQLIREIRDLCFDLGRMAGHHNIVMRAMNTGSRVEECDKYFEGCLFLLAQS